MKAYVATTGAIFGLLTLAHLLRIVVEGRHLATDPLYVLISKSSRLLASRHLSSAGGEYDLNNH
jgi:hypothetical protein